MDLSEEILGEFLVESHEKLDRLDRDLAAQERNPRSRDLSAGVLRTIHTIRSTSGFLGLNQLESISHLGESMLSRLPDGVLALDGEHTAALQDLVNAIRRILLDLETTGREGVHDLDGLRQRLVTLQEPGATSEPEPAPVTVVLPADPAPAAPAASSATPEPAASGAADESAAPRLGEALVAEKMTTFGSVEAALLEQQIGDPRPIGEILVEHGAVAKTDLAEALEKQTNNRRAVADSSISVDGDLFDTLVRLVGELILTRDQIGSLSSQLRDNNLLRASQRLTMIANEYAGGCRTHSDVADRQLLPNSTNPRQKWPRTR